MTSSPLHSLSPGRSDWATQGADSDSASSRLQRDSVVRLVQRLQRRAAAQVPQLSSRMVFEGLIDELLGLCAAEPDSEAQVDQQAGTGDDPMISGAEKSANAATSSNLEPPQGAAGDGKEADATGQSTLFGGPNVEPDTKPPDVVIRIDDKESANPNDDDEEGVKQDASKPWWTRPWLKYTFGCPCLFIWYLWSGYTCIFCLRDCDREDAIVQKDDETDDEYQARKAAMKRTEPNIIGCLIFNLFAVPVLCLWGICWISCCCPQNFNFSEEPRDTVEENPKFGRIHRALLNLLLTGKLGGLGPKSGPTTSPGTFESETSASPPTKEIKETPPIDGTGQPEVCDIPLPPPRSTST